MEIGCFTDDGFLFSRSVTISFMKRERTVRMKLCRPACFSKPVELDGIKIRVVQLSPDSRESDRVPVPEQVPAKQPGSSGENTEKLFPAFSIINEYLFTATSLRACR
jgi:hypothetical protein